MVADALHAIRDGLTVWWPFLLEVSLKSFVLLSFTVLAAWLVRRKSAAARHFVWSTGIVGALLLPLFATTLPTWGILPAEWAIARPNPTENKEVATESSVPVTVYGKPASSLVGVSLDDKQHANVIQSHDTQTGLLNASVSSDVHMASAAASLPGENAELNSAGADGGFFDNRVVRMIDWAQIPTWLVELWVAGAVVLFARILAGQLLLVFLAHHSRYVSSGPIWSELQQLRKEFGIQRPILLYESKSCITPMAWGIFIPKILVPANAEKWSEDRLRSVLLHELSHISRWDCATQMLAQMATAFFWFNPLVWVASRRMRFEREQACDDRVLVAGTKAAEYARHLLEVTAASRTSRLVDVAAVGMARRSQLESRIQAVLDRRRSRVPLSNSGIATFFVATVMLAAGLGTAGAATHIIEPIEETISSTLDQAQRSATPAQPSWSMISNTLRGHVASVAWSPDGNRLAFGEANVVRIHDAHTLALINALTGHTGNVHAVAWSPDGRLIASGSEDKTVRVWDADGDGHQLAVFSEHERAINDIVWSPDGQHIASAGVDTTVRVCSVDGSPELIYRGHSAPVRCVSWSSTGGRLASGDENQMLHIWQFDGTNVVRLDGDAGPIVAVDWSPDGHQVAAATQGRFSHLDTERTTSTVSIYTEDGTPGPIVRSQRGEIQDVAWNPDGSTFASGGDDGSVWIWKADGTPLKVHEAGYREVSSLAWSPDGAHMAIGSRNRLFILQRDGRREATLSNTKNFVQTVAWSADGRQIAVGCEDGTVRMYGADQTVGWVTKVSKSPVHAVSWSPDGGTVAVGTGDCSMLLVEREGTVKRTFEIKGGFPMSISWNPNGKSLAAGCSDGTIHVLTLKTGNQSMLRGHKNFVHSVAWSPDGSLLASGSFDSTVRLWKADGTPSMKFDQHEGGVNEVSWSPDGKRIAAGDLHAVRVWNIDGTPGPVMPTNDAIDVRWSPDGSKIAAANWDSTVSQWFADGTPAAVSTAHSAPVVAIDWSPDSGHLVTGSYDSTMGVCDAETGKNEWTAFLLDGGQSVTLDAERNRIEGYSQAVDREFKFAVADADGHHALVDYATFLKQFAANAEQ